MFGLLILLVCIFGIVSNVLTIIIFSRRTLRNPINVILVGLAVIDLVVVTLSIFLFAVPLINEYLQLHQIKRIEVYLYLYLYPICMTARTSSVWTFVLITIERYTVVCHPFRERTIATCRGAGFAVISIMTTAFAYNFVRFWEFKAELVADIYVPDLRLRSNQNYQFYYYTGAYLITHFIIPFCAIIILSICITRAMTTAKTEQINLNAHQVRENRTTIMMVVLIVTFIVTNTLPYILNFIEAADRGYFLQHLEYFDIVMDVSNMLVVLNSSTNLVIYLTFCQRFRSEFRLFLTEKKCQYRRSNQVEPPRTTINRHIYRAVSLQNTRSDPSDPECRLLRTETVDLCISGTSSDSLKHEYHSAIDRQISQPVGNECQCEK